MRALLSTAHLVLPSTAWGSVWAVATRGSSHSSLCASPSTWEGISGWCRGCSAVLSAVAVLRMFMPCHISEGTCRLLELLCACSPELLFFPETPSGTFSSMPSLGLSLKGKQRCQCNNLECFLPSNIQKNPSSKMEIKAQSGLQQDVALLFKREG